MSAPIPESCNLKEVRLYVAENELEDEAINLGKDHYDQVRFKAISRKDISHSSPENQIIMDRIVLLSDAMIDNIMTSGHSNRSIRHILFKVCADELAFITLKTALNLCVVSVKGTDKQVSFFSVCRNVGKRVGQHIEYNEFKKAATKEQLESIEKASTSRKIAMSRGMATDVWPEDTNERAVLETRVGCWCLDRLLETDVGKELFELKNIRLKKDKIVKQFQMKPSALVWLNKAHEKCSLMSPQFMPMVVPPVDWTSTYSGGFLSQVGPYRLPAVRYRHATQIDAERESMRNVYRCLNALQRTPFRINKQVLAVMQQDESQGKGFRLHWQLWTADKFKDYDQIFFCWYADWRGRVYPVQQYVNPQSDSNGKALLEFAKGKPLGKEGARWLAIHGANTFGNGIDKVSFDNRVSWIEEHQALILDSARNPLNGSQLWRRADKPFMFLAFCFEWIGYVEHGETFVSHLPVNVDGSCSGLQHYSALLRDEKGGKHVNLVPCANGDQDRPEDIYAKVAEESQKTVASDLALDPGNEWARFWNGRVDRSVTKRNTMTWTYSATLYGFAEQLLEKTEAKKAAYYLATVNLESIKKTVVKAAEGMKYLQGVARVAADCKFPPAAGGTSLSWVSPSGFRVHHRYVKRDTQVINTIFGGTRIRLSLASDTDTIASELAINKRKSVAGIAPNFIHSLDAAHLVLTVNACLDQGIVDFAMVHDSFGCHAADMTAMNRILRDEFVKMYATEGGILQDFHEQIKGQLPAIGIEKLPTLPEQGRLNLDLIRHSLYFFA